MTGASRDCLVHPRLNMSTEPDMTSLYWTRLPAQLAVIWPLADMRPWLQPGTLVG